MYACIVLSFFKLLVENLLQAQQVRPRYAVPQSFGFFARFTHVKNSSKKVTIGIFFFSFFKFYLFIFIINQFQRKIKHVSYVFCVSIIALCLEVYVCPSRGFFYFVSIFNFAQINYINCLIQFSVYKVIFCIYQSVRGYKYFFCLSFLIALEKSSPSRANLIGFSYIFQT